MRLRVFLSIASPFLIGALTSLPAKGQALSLDLEAVKIENVGASFQTVPLVNTYANPVVVCTYNLRSDADNDATVRVQNTQPDSFDVRVQRFENSSAFTPSDVHCLVADEGVHTLTDGRVIEARTVLSTVTAGQVLGWGSANSTNVTSQVTGGHSSLVVLGQVMSFNDPEASGFFSYNCNNRGVPPTPGNICVGKHIGQINNTRASETLGWTAVDDFVRTYLEAHPEPETPPMPLADADVRLYGDGAWVSYEQDDADQGRKRETRLMEQVNGAWKIAGMHTTIYGTAQSD